MLSLLELLVVVVVAAAAVVVVVVVVVAVCLPKNRSCSLKNSTAAGPGTTFYQHQHLKMGKKDRQEETEKVDGQLPYRIIADHDGTGYPKLWL